MYKTRGAIPGETSKTAVGLQKYANAIHTSNNYLSTLLTMASTGSSNFLDRMSSDIGKRGHEAQLTQFKKDHPRAYRQYMKQQNAGKGGASDNGPKIVVHGATKINESKDHTWGPLGW
jgi:hypothetical protein